MMVGPRHDIRAAGRLPAPAEQSFSSSLPGGGGQTRVRGPHGATSVALRRLLFQGESNGN